MRKFRACVAGMGFIGTVHVEALRRLGNIEVVAVSNRHNAQAKADALSVPKGYADYREMIDREQPDVVHIATPNDSHYAIAMYAMQHGCAIVLEKPITTTIGEAEALVAYARANHIVNGVNFNCRYYPMAVQMRSMIAHGALGDIFTVNGGYIQDWLLYDTDYSWRVEPDQSGASRAFADIGSHWIDLVEATTGLKTVAVMADFGIFHKTRKKPLKPTDTFAGMALKPEDYADVPVTTEDYANVLLRFDNGAKGCCAISQVFAGRKNQLLLSIGGSKQALHWDSEDSNYLWLGRRDTANGVLPKDPSLLDAAAARVTGYPGGHVEGFPDTFKEVFRAVYQAIEANDPSYRGFARLEEGLRDMRILHAVIESARTDRWVKIEER